MDDNKELVEKIARAIYRSNPQYRYDTEETARFLEYEESDLNADIALRQAQAALSIIQPELARKDKIIDAYERGVAMINNAVSDAQSIIDLRKLKTTTGHDNNTQKRGKR